MSEYITKDAFCRSFLEALKQTGNILISRSEIIEHLTEKGYPFQCVKEIEEAPLSEFAQVIRCKNCVYYGTIKETDIKVKGSCGFWYECLLGVTPDDFCSHAVRRT